MLQALSLVLTLASVTRAWSINGHLIVANVAQNYLMENAPDSLDAANEMLTYLQDYDSEFTYHEVDHAFVECATFADDYKYHGEGWQGDFHFIDIAYVDEGKESDYDIGVSTRNLTTGLYDIVAWLSGKNGTAYQESYIYNHLMEEFPDNEDVAKSYALRLLIHYIGDLVQPFHCEERYDSAYPDGDVGANAFPLKYHYDVDELHALWDKVLYTQHNNIPRPISQEDWDELQPETLQLMADYSDYVADESVYMTTDFDTWAHESYEIATGLYDGVYENLAVPQAYLDKNIPVANSRLVIGGHRLGYIIDYIFGDAQAGMVAEEVTEPAVFLN